MTPHEVCGKALEQYTTGDLDDLLRVRWFTSLSFEPHAARHPALRFAPERASETQSAWHISQVVVADKSSALSAEYLNVHHA
jgi:hypothetical protein